MSRESRYGHIDNFDNLIRLIEVELENHDMQHVNFTVNDLRDYILEKWLEVDSNLILKRDFKTLSLLKI